VEALKAQVASLQSSLVDAQQVSTSALDEAAALRGEVAIFQARVAEQAMALQRALENEQHIRTTRDRNVEFSGANRIHGFASGASEWNSELDLARVSEGSRNGASRSKIGTPSSLQGASGDRVAGGPSQACMRLRVCA